MNRVEEEREQRSEEMTVGGALVRRPTPTQIVVHDGHKLPRIRGRSGRFI